MVSYVFCKCGKVVDEYERYCHWCQEMNPIIEEIETLQEINELTLSNEELQKLVELTSSKKELQKRIEKK